MKSSKKGSDISLNVIIVAAIALIVLVVLVMIFTGRMGNWVKSSDAITNMKCVDADKRPGAQVAAATSGCPANYQQVVGAFTDVASDQICCVPQ